MDFENLSDIVISPEMESETLGQTADVQAKDEMKQVPDTEIVNTVALDEKTVSEISENENTETKNAFEECLTEKAEEPSEIKKDTIQHFKRPEPKPISVYVKRNEKEQVIDVNSDIFIKDFDGWEKIDEGFGDRFAHAQALYFDKPIIDENGNYQIYLVKE